jgi:predicted Rdx family selenoprotein
VEAEIKGSFDAEVVLERGSGGVFDVLVDRELVYSKARTSRFPRSGEITKLIRARS